MRSLAACAVHVLMVGNMCYPGHWCDPKYEDISPIATGIQGRERQQCTVIFFAMAGQQRKWEVKMEDERKEKFVVSSFPRLILFIYISHVINGLQQNSSDVQVSSSTH